MVACGADRAHSRAGFYQRVDRRVGQAGAGDEFQRAVHFGHHRGFSAIARPGATGGGRGAVFHRRIALHRLCPAAGALAASANQRAGVGRVAGAVGTVCALAGESLRRAVFWIERRGSATHRDQRHLAEHARHRAAGCAHRGGSRPGGAADSAAGGQRSPAGRPDRWRPDSQAVRRHARARCAARLGAAHRQCPRPARRRLVARQAGQHPAGPPALRANHRACTRHPAAQPAQRRIRAGPHGLARQCRQVSAHQRSARSRKTRRVADSARSTAGYGSAGLSQPAALRPERAVAIHPL